MTYSAPVHDASDGNDPIGSVRRWLDTWLLELADAMHAVARRLRGRSLVLINSEAATDIYVHSGRRVTALGRIPSGTGQPAEHAVLRATIAALVRARVPVRLRLAPDQVLERTLEFPVAVRDVLVPVLTNQLLRVTPWPAGELCFNYVIRGTDAATNQLTVDAVVTSHARVNRALAEVSQLGLQPDAVDFAADATTTSGLVLRKLDAKARSDRARSIGYVLAAGAALALLSGSVGTYKFLERRFYLASLDAGNAVLLQKLRPSEQARQQRGSRTQDVQRLYASKIETTPVILALDRLSAALPDQAWLTNLSLSEDKLTIAGKARDAAGLVGNIERSGDFADVMFAAPTVRDEASGLQLFTISARVVAGRQP